MRIQYRIWISAGLTATFLGTASHGQSISGTEDAKLLYSIREEAGGTIALGASVSCVGDIDGDGTDDFIVGAPNSGPTFALVSAGSAIVYSGATGTQIFRFDGMQNAAHLGNSVSGAGDVDGDGFNDVIVGARLFDASSGENSGSAFVYSGATGTQLFQFDGQASDDQFGSSVSGAGDVNGDGFDDLIVGAPGADPNGQNLAGSAFVFSGATGTQLFRFDGPATFSLMGGSVSGAGDVNGDGFADLIVGAERASFGGSFSGSAFVFSGATGSQLFRFDGGTTNELFGLSVSGAGDVNADGLDDLIVGAIGHNFAISGAGSATVFSGATGAQLLQFVGTEISERLGLSVSGAGDVDGDGFADLVVGAPGARPSGLNNSGSAFVFSGRTGSQMIRIDADSVGDNLGPVSGAGDVNGDGLDDLIVGAPGLRSQGLAIGAAYVISFNPILTASSQTFSLSAGGTIDYTIDFPDADAGSTYQILISAGGSGSTTRHGLVIPLSNDPLFRASLRGKTPSFALGFQGVLDSQGRATAQVVSPTFNPLSPHGPSLSFGGYVIPLQLAVINSNFNFSSAAVPLSFLR